jgi:hypothetical protein
MNTVEYHWHHKSEKAKAVHQYLNILSKLDPHTDIKKQRPNNKDDTSAFGLEILGWVQPSNDEWKS